MTTTTQKKKLSKGTWALIFILIAALITVVVLAAVGYISLQFIADGINGFMTFGSAGWMEGTIVLVLPFLGGILLFYIVKTYFIGNTVKGVNTGSGMGYNPQPTAPSATQKDTETVIS